MKSYKNLLVNAEIPISWDLKSGDFFSDQHPSQQNLSMQPPLENLFFLFGPPLTEQFQGKNVSICQGLQFVEYSNN